MHRKCPFKHRQERSVLEYPFKRTLTGVACHPACRTFWDSMFMEYGVPITIFGIQSSDTQGRIVLPRAHPLLFPSPDLWICKSNNDDETTDNNK